MITIVLAWPDRVLAPNSRPHWSTRAAAVSLARYAAKLETLRQAPRARFPSGAALRATLVFCPANHRPHDLTNLEHSMKSALDGVFDALKLDNAGIDDRQIKRTETAWGEQCDGGRVEFSLEVL